MDEVFGAAYSDSYYNTLAYSFGLYQNYIEAIYLKSNEMYSLILTNERLFLKSILDELVEFRPDIQLKNSNLPNIKFHHLVYLNFLLFCRVRIKYSHKTVETHLGRMTLTLLRKLGVFCDQNTSDLYYIFFKGLRHKYLPFTYKVKPLLVGDYTICMKKFKAINRELLLNKVILGTIYLSGQRGDTLVHICNKDVQISKVFDKNNNNPPFIHIKI